MTGTTTKTVSTTPTTMATTIAFKDGYIKDEWSQLVEPIQRGVEGRAFLWTGRKAEVGQRTETQVTSPSPTDGTKEGWCRLSGVVTEVGAMPTLDQWRDGNSCQLPPGVKSNALPIEEQLSEREEFIEHFGTLHGQTITSYAFLNFDFYDRQESLPFKRGRVYKIIHVADENMSFFWCVAKIEDVTDCPMEEMPDVFMKWQESRTARTCC